MFRLRGRPFRPANEEDADGACYLGEMVEYTFVSKIDCHPQHMVNLQLNVVQ